MGFESKGAENFLVAKARETEGNENQMIKFPSTSMDEFLSYEQFTSGLGGERYPDRPSAIPDLLN